MVTTDLMSVTDMCKHLKLSRATVQKWCRSGFLPAAKIGKEYRIRKDDLNRWYNSKIRQATQ